MPLPASFLPAYRSARFERNFAQVSKIVLIVWLLGILLPLNLYWGNHTQYGASRKVTFKFPNADFSQYYLAGAGARYGLWDHLYPKFKPEWVGKPGRKIWSSDNAQADPEVLEKVPGLGGWYVENIAPPPQAILCLPFAYFSFAVAFKIWMTGLILATVGALLCTVRIYRRIGGESGYVEGLLFLSGAFLPLLPRIGGGDNAVVVLVFCLGLAALAWVDRRPFTLATCMIVPAVFKGLTATWCPLLLIPPIRWRTLAWLSTWTILLNGLVLWWGGIPPYTTWLSDIMPNATSMEIQQYWHHCMNLKGIAYDWGWESFPTWAMRGLYLIGLFALYYGFWKQRNARRDAALAPVCAALVAALALFNLFNAVSWLPYLTFLLPFVGWAIVEYDQFSPSVKTFWKILAALFLLLLPLVHLLLSRFILRHPEPLSDAGRDLYVGVEILFLLLAYRRLFSESPS